MTPSEIEAALSAPFDPSEIKWRAGPVTKDGKSAMALAYIDARLVQDRLNKVLGTFGWEDEYTPTGQNGGYLCKLRCRVGDEWITKMDVGGESEQKDAGDRSKAAVSDALKRTAVKFGIGRFLYSLPKQWAAWNAQKGEFVNEPTLPAELMPQPPVKVDDLFLKALAILAPATFKGTEDLATLWKSISPEMRKAIAPLKDYFKAVAQMADKKGVDGAVTRQGPAE